jgi:RNA polymerase sigma factor FliA
MTLIARIESTHENEALQPLDSNQLILEQLPSVRNIARRVRVKLPRHIELEELESAGAIGLMDAATRFDPSMGVQFKTYAEVRIRGAMLDSLREMDWAPRSVRKQFNEMKKIYSRLEQSLGRQPSEDEVCDELKIPTERYHELLNKFCALNIAHLSTPGPEEYERKTESQISIFSHSPDKTPSEIIHNSEIKQIMEKAIGRLSSRLKLIIMLYYFEDLHFKEIGEILGVNESRVSQCHSEAIRKLRIMLKVLSQTA